MCNPGHVAALGWEFECVVTVATVPVLRLTPFSVEAAITKAILSANKGKKQMPAILCVCVCVCVFVGKYMCVMATEDNDTPDDGLLSV